MSVGCVGTMYEDTGPPWLAASGKRYSNGGLTFLAHLCRLELQHATAAPRWSGSTGADDASGPAGGMFSMMFSDIVAATVRSLELSFTPQLSAGEGFLSLGQSTDLSHFFPAPPQYEIPGICTI